MSKTELLLKAGDIVAAYASHNETSVEELLELLDRTAKQMFELTMDSPLKPKETPLVPPVPINESYGHDFIICLEDGKKVTILERHLKRHHDMTFDQYRKKWDLPVDYPRVTQSYSDKRSKIAKKQGLGMTRG